MKLEAGGCGQKAGLRKELIMYTKEKKEKALKVYEEVRSVSKVIQKLGYPTREGFYKWLREWKNGSEKVKAARRRINNRPEHPLHPSPELKMETIRRCFELGENVKLVSEEIGYSRPTIYAWKRLYDQKGAVAFMKYQDIPRGKLEEPSNSTLEDIAEMKAQMRKMQLKIDVLEETIKVIKKGQDVSPPLTNKEKAAIVDVLKKEYSLPEVLENLKLAKSSYYYLKQNKKDKYAQVRIRIREIFNENQSRYGYRRINAVLSKENIKISEKIIRRIMKEENLQVKSKKTRKYNSYKGEITPAVENLISREFHSEKPNEKWLSDLTEFAIPAGKVYLSPIVDCFDGFITAWTIGKNPNADLVNDMLLKAASTLKKGENPIVHTDRGSHYRWPGWIEVMEKFSLKRSMSKKGCSPDNSACEGFFGRLKNEFFYGRDWSDYTIEEFISALDQYIVWYNNIRIKKSLGFLSPAEYRQKLGLVA